MFWAGSVCALLDLSFVNPKMVHYVERNDDGDFPLSRIYPSWRVGSKYPSQWKCYVKLAEVEWSMRDAVQVIWIRGFDDGENIL